MLLVVIVSCSIYIFYLDFTQDNYILFKMFYIKIKFKKYFSFL